MGEWEGKKGEDRIKIGGERWMREELGKEVKDGRGVVTRREEGGKEEGGKRCALG